MENINTVLEIISKEGLGSTDIVIKEWALMIALSKIDKYQSECDFFSHKYNMSFKDFDVYLHENKGKEIFRKEEDFEDWEFSLNALKWWSSKARDLRNA